jgi:hypothetical protein
VIDAPEAPHQHHPAHTGHRWLDILLGLGAMFVSVVSLVVAVEHGQTMERMADANTKMVEANSWPFISFDTHDLNEQSNAGPDQRGESAPPASKRSNCGGTESQCPHRAS